MANRLKSASTQPAAPTSASTTSHPSTATIKEQADGHGEGAGAAVGEASTATPAPASTSATGATPTGIAQRTEQTSHEEEDHNTGDGCLQKDEDEQEEEGVVAEFQNSVEHGDKAARIGLGPPLRLRSVQAGIRSTLHAIASRLASRFCFHWGRCAMSLRMLAPKNSISRVLS